MDYPPYFGTTLGLPPGERGGGLAGVGVGRGAGGATCILGARFSFGLMPPSGLSSLSLGLLPGGGVLVRCAADGIEPYTTEKSTTIETVRTTAVARIWNRMRIHFACANRGGHLPTHRRAGGVQTPPPSAEGGLRPRSGRAHHLF